MENNTDIEISEEELKDIKSCTSFTDDEIHTRYKKFHEDYPDGVIKISNFIEIYSKLYPKGDAHPFATVVFKSYDTDGNGAIDFREFMATLSLSSRGSSKEKTRWVFSLYDMDNDGLVSLTDITKMIGDLYKLRGEYEESNAENAGLKVFEELGKSKEDQLIIEEFVEGASGSQVIMDVFQKKQ